jgi:hypothetical protein
MQEYVAAWDKKIGDYLYLHENSIPAVQRQPPVKVLVESYFSLDILDMDVEERSKDKWFWNLWSQDQKRNTIRHVIRRLCHLAMNVNLPRNRFEVRIQELREIWNGKHVVIKLRSSSLNTITKHLVKYFPNMRSLTILTVRVVGRKLPESWKIVKISRKLNFELLKKALEQMPPAVFQKTETENIGCSCRRGTS